MTDGEFSSLIYNRLVEDINQRSTYPALRPLLAHYTSIDTVEKILQYKELWFSNPLFMNDLEELRFGIRLGVAAFHENTRLIDACGGSERHQELTDWFNQFSDQFEEDHAFDVYALCFSEHDPETHADGLLSMWRGYGNNGNGAAIIIDTSKINPDANTPLMLSDVQYGTASERKAWVIKKIDEFAALLAELNPPTIRLRLAAYAIFERIKIFALFSKHKGFSEEKEWRAVYLREIDPGQRMDEMLSYCLGSRGLEPKLKLQLEPEIPYPNQDLSLKNLVHSMILGPSLSSPMMVKSVHRMLKSHGMGDLNGRVSASSTPYRSS